MIPVPSVADYITSILSAKKNFYCLTSLRPILNKDKQPIMLQSKSSLIFKMRDTKTRKHYALKIYLQNPHNEVIPIIINKLKEISSPFIVPCQYYNDELYVYSDCIYERPFYPILLMDWVEGKTLGTYIKEHIDEPKKLNSICKQFTKLTTWLISQPFAHGNLNSKNILVRKNGSLVLVDYDKMFFPDLKGHTISKPRDPNFHHPLHEIINLNKHIDDFPLASIALSLKAIALKPRLFKDYGSTNRLLFSASDYYNLGNCKLITDLQYLLNNKELSNLYSLFLLAWYNQDFSSILQISFSPKVTEDFANSQVNIFGIDNKKLFKEKECIKKIKKYHIKKGTMIICNELFYCCSSLESITIPKSMKYIRKQVFEDCKSLKFIVIPETVTHIGDRSFFFCTSLKSITIPKSVKYIGNQTFAECSSLEFITIPESVTYIGNEAFSGCKSLKSIIIPNSVKQIGDQTFKNCHSLESIIIPESITHIGDKAFWGCKSLKSIIIPSSVKQIGNEIFSGCSSLKSIIIPDPIKCIENWGLSGCIALESITISQSTSHTDQRIFNGWIFSESKQIFSSKLLFNTIKIEYNHHSFIVENQTVFTINKERLIHYFSKDSIYSSMPKSIKTIGKHAFEDCKLLKSIIIPNSVTNIEDWAFQGCSALEFISIPESVTHIGKGVFKGCSSLKSIIIPESVTHIEDKAFMSCKSLQYIHIPSSIKQIKDWTFFGCSSLANITIPETVTYIGERAFQNCKFLSIHIPNSIKRIRDYTFAGCTVLENIIIPNSVKSIERGAFDGCKSLKSITIPNSINHIGSFVFDGCLSLESIILPKSLKRLGGAFGYTKLKNITCKSKNFIIENQTLFTINKDCLIYFWGENDQYIIPESVEIIESVVFQKCPSLKSIYLPNSIQDIGTMAIDDYTIESIIIPPGTYKKFSRLLKRSGYYGFFELKKIKEGSLDNLTSFSSQPAK